MHAQWRGDRDSGWQREKAPAASMAAKSPSLFKNEMRTANPQCDMLSLNPVGTLILDLKERERERELVEGKQRQTAPSS